MIYTKENIFTALETFETIYGRMPSLRELVNTGINKSVYYRIFGSLSNAIEYYIKTKNIDSFDLYDDEVIPKNVKDGLIDTLKNNLSEHELRTLVASTGMKANKPKKYIKSKPEVGHFKFLVTGDSHIGHKKFREDWWNEMIDRGYKENVDFMYHTGDILEGMSGRPGHVYELDHIGFESQFSEAKRLIRDIPFDFKCIIGNHDLWYAGKADQGINVGNRLEESLDNVIFLGNEEADDVVNGITVKLWHGQDGASYAYSYRTQKFVEMLSGGEKPHILLAGHAHKSIFYETRNVHVFETGTTCMQTGFMRGKKLAAHTGYWIVDVWTNDDGISRIRPEWNAWYI